MQLQFKLDVFEGPLDLLLHLIAKHKLNIYDVEISKLLEQYLDHIEQMKMADLEVASEFLEMAARLIYIKTVSLLPKHEEAEELKRELTGQLLEYQACKAAAARLALLNNGFNIFVRQPAEVPIDKTYLREHESGELIDAYLDVAGKAKRRLPPPASAFSGIVTKRMVSVTSRIIYVLRKLYNSGEVPYNDFFATSDRSEMVATFLAMLELIKSKRIQVSDDNTTVYFDRTQRKGYSANE